jgi:hypothetical protein
MTIKDLIKLRDASTTPPLVVLYICKLLKRVSP